MVGDLVLSLFKDGWKHRSKVRPKVNKIFAIRLPDHLNETYEAYKYVVGINVVFD